MKVLQHATTHTGHPITPDWTHLCGFPWLSKIGIHRLHQSTIWYIFSKFLYFCFIILYRTRHTITVYHYTSVSVPRWVFKVHWGDFLKNQISPGFFLASKIPLGWENSTYFLPGWEQNYSFIFYITSRFPTG